MAQTVLGSPFQPKPVTVSSLKPSWTAAHHSLPHSCVQTWICPSVHPLFLPSKLPSFQLPSFSSLSLSPPSPFLCFLSFLPFFFLLCLFCFPLPSIHPQCQAWDTELPSAPPPGSVGKMRSFYRTRGLAEVRPLTVDSTPALVLTGDPARLSALGPDLSTEDTDESEPDSGLQELTTRRERERDRPRNSSRTRQMGTVR